MNQTVTLQLPNKLMLTAQTVANQTKRPLEEILLEWLDKAVTDLPVEALSDEEVIALTKMEMDASQQTELSELLAGNREDNLTAREQQHLNELMQLYRHGLRRKAEAVKVAVARGLISPLN